MGSYNLRNYMENPYSDVKRSWRFEPSFFAYLNKSFHHKLQYAIPGMISINGIAKQPWKMLPILMDALAQLESRVEQLLAHLRMLEEKNMRLESELACVRLENRRVLDENQSLRDSLRECEELRHMALERLEALLIRIRARVKAG